MASWILLLSLRTSFAQLVAQSIAEKLMHTKNFVLPDHESLTIVRDEEISATTDSILIEFLKLSIEPVFIKSWTNVNGSIETTSVILFTKNRYPESLPSPQRILIVASEDIFPELLENCVSRNSSNVAFLVYNSAASWISHYNPYHGILNTWLELDTDPMQEAASDLAGHSVSTDFLRVTYYRLMETVALKLNGTVSSEPGDIQVNYVPSPMAPFLYNIYKPFYVHRTGYFHVLVPRLNRPLPAIYILIYPLDQYSWLLCLTSILLLALFRTFLTKHHTVQQLIKVVLHLLASITAGTSIQPFHRDLERQLVGLFLLFYVVLINCYQSLVISYLLSPRFYPELNTLQQLNDSCCWDRYADVDDLKLKHHGDCEQDLGIAVLLGDSPQEALSAHRMSLCVPVDSWLKDVLVNYRGRTIPGFGHFRWSKQVLNQWPILASVWFDWIVGEKVRELVGVFFAEGALYKRFEEDDLDLSVDGSAKSFSLNDLWIIWLIYAIGMTSAGMVLVVEIVLSKVKKVIQLLI